MTDEEKRDVTKMTPEEVAKLLVVDGALDANTVAKLVLGGATQEAIAGIATEIAGRPTTPREIEEMTRADYRHLYEIEAIARQAPGAVSAVFDQQVMDTMHAADARPWARGFRCGYATAKGEASLAVSHMGNAIVARSEGLTREDTK